MAVGGASFDGDDLEIFIGELARDAIGVHRRVDGVDRAGVVHLKREVFAGRDADAGASERDAGGGVASQVGPGIGGEGRHGGFVDACLWGGSSYNRCG